VLFLKCVAALFSPVYRRPGEGIKWGYVSYTVVMFSLATVVTAMNLHTQAISYIDNRNFPGVEGGLPPGPYGYLQSIYFKVTKVIPDVAFLLNNWLSEGLLVSSSFDVVLARPCLTPTLPALSLLRDLLYELLGRLLPLPHVPRFCGYVFESSRNAQG